MKKRLSIAVIIVVVLVVAFFVIKAILFPAYKEVETTGEYNVGHEDYWITEDREDPFLKDGSMREVQIRAWFPVTVEESHKKMPVIVASHGSCGTIDNNESLYKELASHGYVVLAIAHPGHAFSTLHSNGKKQSVSMQYLKEMGEIEPQTKPEQAAELYAKWMELRMTDMNYVMDDFKQRAVTEAAFACADTGRYITVGHSAGGATAMGMARVRDDVVGVISLEAPCMYDIKGVKDGEYVIDDTDYPVPLLSIYSDASYSHLHEWKAYQNNVKFLESTNENYVNIYYEGIGHMGLCDLSLASPLLSEILDGKKSEVDAREQLSRLNEDCLRFLERF